MGQSSDGSCCEITGCPFGSICLSVHPDHLVPGSGSPAYGLKWLFTSLISLLGSSRAEKSLNKVECVSPNKRGTFRPNGLVILQSAIREMSLEWGDATDGGGGGGRLTATVFL